MIVSSPGRDFAAVATNSARCYATRQVKPSMSKNQVLLMSLMVFFPAAGLLGVFVLNGIDHGGNMFSGLMTVVIAICGLLTLFGACGLPFYIWAFYPAEGFGGLAADSGDASAGKDAVSSPDADEEASDSGEEADAAEEFADNGFDDDSFADDSFDDDDGFVVDEAGDDGFDDSVFDDDAFEDDFDDNEFDEDEWA